MIGEGAEERQEGFTDLFQKYFLDKMFSKAFLALYRETDFLSTIHPSVIILRSSAKFIYLLLLYSAKRVFKLKTYPI